MRFQSILTVLDAVGWYKVGLLANKLLDCFTNRVMTGGGAWCGARWLHDVGA